VFNLNRNYEYIFDCKPELVNALMACLENSELSILPSNNIIILYVLFFFLYCINKLVVCASVCVFLYVCVCVCVLHVANYTLTAAKRKAVRTNYNHSKKKAKRKKKSSRASLRNVLKVLS